jgi:hypothetical protein
MAKFHSRTGAYPNILERNAPKTRPTGQQYRCKLCLRVFSMVEVSPSTWPTNTRRLRSCGGIWTRGDAARAREITRTILGFRGAAHGHQKDDPLMVELIEAQIELIMADQDLPDLTDEVRAAIQAYIAALDRVKAATTAITLCHEDLRQKWNPSWRSSRPRSYPTRDPSRERSIEIPGVDFLGKTNHPTTSAGTQGIVAASRAERLYAASLVTAEANVRALLSGSPDQISLVAIGNNGINRTDEDELCAILFRNHLKGRPGDADAIRRLILAGGEVGRFHDPSRPYLHPEDVDIALDINRFDFAVRVEFENGRPVARIETPAAATPNLPT